MLAGFKNQPVPSGNLQHHESHSLPNILWKRGPPFLGCSFPSLPARFHRQHHSVFLGNEGEGLETEMETKGDYWK